MKTKLFTLLLAVAASIGTVFSAVTIGGIAYNLDDATLTAEVTEGGHYSGSIFIPSSITYNGKSYSVTSIRYSAFYWLTDLTYIEIPNSVTDIGDQAFFNCTSLTSITIPNSVTSIGNWAFMYCSSLTSIEIPNSVTYIGEGAFNYCTGLTSVTIPNSVTSMKSAFCGCDGLTSMSVAAGNIFYDSRDNCNAIIETATNTLIAGCQSSIIPNSVTSIGNDAFYSCSSLTSITIPNSVTSIGSYAFSECDDLTSITIPNSVTYIGVGAFHGCGGLTQPVYNAHVFAYMHSSYSEAYTIPDGIEQISGSAFWCCSRLPSINIPNSVTNIGSGAFYRCYSLNSVTIPNSVTSIGSSAFKECTGLTSIEIPNSVTSIGGWAFQGCSGLISVTILNSVTSIGKSAFNGCSSLTSATIGNGVTSIGDYAFRNCSSLTSVTIPNSVTSIGESAFSYCSSLTSITCEAVNPPTLGESVFNNVDKSIPLYVPAQSIDLYKAADQWKDFTNILPITSSTPETFTITFLNYDGSELQSSEVEAGTMPQYNGAEPTRPADDENTYTFSGWTPAVVAVAGNASYTATFQSVPFVKYTITWQDEDGNVIKTDQVAQGTTPAFTGTTPTKPATNEYTYEFAGWLPKIKPATEDVRYTTFFERNKIETPVYTVNINGENCSLNINNQYPEGTVITLEAVADECFEFQQWSDGNKDNPRSVTVTKDMSLTAEFNKVRYTITDKTEPGTGGKIQIVGQ